MEKLIKLCITNTLYDINIYKHKKSLLDDSVKLLSDTIINIIQTNNIPLDDLYGNLKIIENNLHTPPDEIKIRPELICPLAILYTASYISNLAIYDLDGCYFLFARCVDSNVNAIEPCITGSTSCYTCCSVNTIAIPTLRQRYLPTNEIQKSYDKTVKNILWNIERSNKIAKTFRSPACCGPSISAVINRRISVPFNDQHQPTDTIAIEKPPSNTKNAKASDYKWSGALLKRSLAFLEHDTNNNNNDNDNDDINDIDDIIVNDELSTPCSSSNIPQSMCSEQCTSITSVDMDNNQYLHDPVSEEIPFYGDVRFDKPQYSVMCNTLSECNTDDNDKMKSSIWTDLACSVTIRDVMREMYPCLCEAEFMSFLIVGKCNPIIVNNEIKAIMSATKYIQHHQYDHRSAIYSIAVELLCGTIQTPLSNDLQLFVTANKDTLYDIAMQIPSVFSLRRLFMNDTKSSRQIEPISFASSTDVLIHQWSLLVESARHEIIMMQERGQYVQQWYITKTTTLPLSVVASTFCQENMHCRVVDLYAAAYMCNTSILHWLEPPNTWPCDVCWTMSLSTHGLHMKSTQVGLAIVGPKRTTAVATSDDGTNMICGSMLYLLGAFRKFPSTISHDGCISVYPFAACVMQFSNKIIQLVDYGTSLIRAAVSHISDACLSFLTINNFIEHNNIITTFANDMGAVSEELVIKHTALHQYEELALESLQKHIWNIFCKGAMILSTESSSSSKNALTLKSIAHAIVCSTRPFRMWVNDPSTIKDLLQRTKLHIQILDNITDPLISNDTFIQMINDLRLANQLRDQLVPVVRPRAMHRVFANYNVEQGDITLQHATDSYKPTQRTDISLYSICDDVGIMSSETQQRYLTSIDIYRQMLSLNTENDNFKNLLLSSYNDHKLPLAEVYYNNTLKILSAPDYMVMANNPMTTSIPVESNHDLVSHCYKSCKSLLPKNSLLLCEMMHHRYGLPILQTALPVNKDMTDASTLYYPMTINAIATNVCGDKNTESTINKYDIMDTFEDNVCCL